MAIPNGKPKKKKSLLKTNKEMKVAELGYQDLQMMDNNKSFQKAIRELNIDKDAMNMSKYYNMFLDFKKGGKSGMEKYEGFGR